MKHFKKEWEGSDNILTSIGKNLKALRSAKKLTQQQAADLMGISRSTISNYEIDRRRPSLAELEKFAEFYGVGLDFFGIASRNEIFDILARAKTVFENESIPKEKKDDLYFELMKLYVNVTEQRKK